MVVVGASCLKQADSQPKSDGLVWGSTAAWRWSTFIKCTKWTLAMTCGHDDSTINIVMGIIIIIAIAADMDEKADWSVVDFVAGHCCQRATHKFSFWHRQATISWFVSRVLCFFLVLFLAESTSVVCDSVVLCVYLVYMFQFYRYCIVWPVVMC